MSGTSKLASTDVAPPAASEERFLDPNLVESLEVNATQLAQNVDYLFESLRSSMHTICTLSSGNMGAYRSACDGLGDAVTTAVAEAHAFLRKLQQVNENLDCIDKMYEDLRELKKSLDVLELQVHKLCTKK